MTLTTITTPVATDFDRIVETWKQRRQAQGPVLERMRSVQEVYDGDVTVPLPEMDTSERTWIANLLQTGLDQTAMRIASNPPDVRYLPEKLSGRDNLKRAQDRASEKRDVTLGWWTQNKMNLKLRRRARWLIGYGVSPVMIRPHLQWNMPMWHVRNPLTTFPAPSLDPDDIEPLDCIYSYKRSLRWLNENFPGRSSLLYKGQDPSPDDTYDFVEYVDAEWHVLGVVGPGRREWEHNDGQSEQMELIRMPNRAGVCPAVQPGRITLGRVQGQYDGMVGVYQIQARLMALEVHAVEKGIYPDTYLISRPNEIAAFIDGPYDGRTGKVNIIKGGDVKEVQTNPGFQTNPTIDRLERAQRLTAGIPTDLTGEAGTNIRTGRRSEVLLSAVLDFPVQEAQELLSASLEAENKRAIAIDKAYFNTSKSFYVNISGRKTQGEYVPRDLFVSDVHFVRYPSAGSDANSLVVGLGQRLGIGLISKATARTIDPYIEEPEREADLTTAEALETALLASIQQQASTGAIPPDDLAFIMEQIASNKMELPGAIMAAQKRAQERQATPVPEGAPEAQPGLGPAGMGAEQPVEGPPAAPPDLGALLGMLGRPPSTQTIVK